MSYVMESRDEARRLVAQERTEPVRRRLLEAGLQASHRALDVGCGPGLLAREMLAIVGGSGEVVGLDQSAERVAQAREGFAGASNARAIRGDLHRMDLPPGHFDFVWSQFVFEYLPDPAAALAELMRVTRPGGKVVVADCDGSGILNHPCEPDLAGELEKFFSVLSKVSGFDLHVGRKMFHHFRRAGLVDVQVRVESQFVTAGAADERTLEDWQIRLRTLEPTVAPHFGSQAAYARFVDRYLGMLADADSLKYGILIITEGRRP